MGSIWPSGISSASGAVVHFLPASGGGLVLSPVVSGEWGEDIRDEKRAAIESGSPRTFDISRNAFIGSISFERSQLIHV